MQISNFFDVLRQTADVSNPITPTRNFNLLYIIMDSIFICLMIGIFIWKKRYSTLLFALFGGILYTVVDYGGFYALSHTRTVSIDGVVQGPGMTFLVLLWMSMSYGFTNFAFIWTLLAKDKYAKYFVFLIVFWWLVCPSISELGGPNNIQTHRTTTAYHGYMGIVAAVCWIGLIIYLLTKQGSKSVINILKLFAIGFFVQFGWEFALLVNGIRPMNAASVKTLLVNSFLETNMCMPLFYLIQKGISLFITEDLKKTGFSLKKVKVTPEPTTPVETEVTTESNVDVNTDSKVSESKDTETLE